MPLFPISRKQFVDELLEMGSKYEVTKNIRDVLFYRSFPVDIRHNVKISREKLAQWAEKKISS
jgi:transposase-like protein